MGFLEGEQELILERQLETFEEEITKIIHYPSNLHVLTPAKGEYPSHRFAALLHCYEATNAIDDFSNLIVGFFVDSCDLNIYEIISEKVSLIDWEKFAYNGGY